MVMKSCVPQITGSFLSAEDLLTSQEGMFSLEFIRCYLVGWLAIQLALDQRNVFMSQLVTYEDALREHEEVKSSALICDSLNEQLTKWGQRATELEQDKERWRLEYLYLSSFFCFLPVW